MSALLGLASEVVLAIVRLTDEQPEPEDVKAGWTAFAVFLLLIGAVVLLGFSLVKQLRKAEAAEEAGLYGSDDPDVPRAGESPQDVADRPQAPGSGQEPESHQAP